MRQAARRPAIIIFCICMAVLMGGSCFWYYRQISEKIYQSMIDNIQELAEHDLNAIRTNVEKNWNQLESIHQRMLYYDYSSVGEMQERLHVEQTTSDIEKLYYVAEDGKLYSGDYIISEDANLTSEFEKEDDRFVIRYDDVDTDIPELQREYLLYGIRVEPWEVEGVVFTGMISKRLTDSMQDELIIQSYDEQGSSSVVDADGYYIINVNRSMSFQERQNFYTAFDQKRFLTGGEDISKIDQKLKNGGIYTTIYRDETGDEKVMTFQKVGQMDWYFIMEISRDVFKKQTSSIMYLSLIAAILVIIALVFSVGMWYMMMRKSLHAKTQIEAKNEFLSNMSHEIRTPLNGLIGLNHLMAQNIDDRDKMKEYLQKASHAAQYLLALVNDILDMSKLQAGKVDLHIAPANLDMILDNVISMQRENIEGRGLHLCVESDIQESWIECDEVRMKQVLMNLLSNAAKFTPRDGTITVRMYQEAAGEVDGKQRIKNCFEVEDTGCGMSEEFQKHIFEAFTQEREHNAESQKGTGLGMSISHLLMEAMDGDLSVKSKLGEGSTFYVSFPAVVTQEPGHIAAEQEIRAADLDLENLNILIAEDNEINAEILTEILKENHITSEVARNGREAVEKFADSAPGTYPIILMDIQMPEMDGYEAAKAIRSLKRADAGTARILACTANTFQEDIDRVMECGMNGFIGKPINIEELFLKLKE
ncbi:MAG: ATP-binding protein [Eubacteriales bacterium]|nr:ATP-binding protein [Eubacteriales bacterium]